MKSQILKNILLICVLIFLAVAERLWFDLGDNVELVTLVTLIAAFYISKKAAVIVALTVLAYSDIFLGNTTIMLFTWSAYLFFALGAGILKRFNQNSMRRIVAATGGGMAASILFYLWTNFGVWLLDSHQMYTNDFLGLIKSYMMGLPFLKAQFLSNLVIIPVVFTLIEFGLHFYFARKQKFIQSLIRVKTII